MSPNEKFNTEFREWRCSRHEYSELVAAIKKGLLLGSPEMQNLRVAAGVTQNEAIELIHLHQRASAKNVCEDAARADALKEQVGELSAEIDALAKRISLETVPIERDRLRDELFTLSNRLSPLKAELARCTVAQSLFAAAKEAGVA